MFVAERDVLKFRVSWICVVLTSMLCGGSLSAEDDAGKPVPARSKETKSKDKVKETKSGKGQISEQRKRDLLEFVARNHQELLPLIDTIRSSAPAEYEAALKDLDRTLDRLEKIKLQSPARYESQLADWRLTSRIRLLAARLPIAKDPQAAEADLRSAVVERLETRLANQRTEAEQLRKRLEKLDATIAETTSKKEELIENEMRQLKAPKPAGNPADLKKAKQSSADPAGAKAGVQ